MIWLLATALAADTLLLPAGSLWHYHDTGVAPSAAWAQPGFDDSAWLSGPARLGYGDPEIVTTVDFGADPANKHITTWFRTTFMASNTAVYDVLRLELIRDDGAVVYLNGVEIVRSNMPAGLLTPATLAASTVSSSAEDTFLPFVVPPDLIVDGLNTLAVELHQRATNSSDLGLDARLFGVDDPVPLVRGPYLQQLSDDGVIVRWRTALPSASTVWLGPAPGALMIAAHDPTLVTDHSVQLGGLEAQTTWTYAIGADPAIASGDDLDHTFTTHAPRGADVPLRIWAIGDSGTADANAAAVYEAFRTFSPGGQADVWLMLGDNAYSSGTDAQYQAAVFDMYPELLRRTSPWPTLGNHDGYTADSATQTGPYYDIFDLPRAGELGGEPSGTEAWYAFDVGTVHFVCLDSYESSLAPGSPMLQWLEDDLARTTAPWVVAFWHHPPYSKGSHDSDLEASLTQIRTEVLPLVEAYGVDLVLTGHSHSYERSMLLDSHYGLSGSLVPSMVLDGGDGDPFGDGAYRKRSPGPAPHEGSVYVVAGSSGQASAAPLDHPAMQVSLPELGSVVIDVSGLALHTTFLDDTATVRDRFTIRKGLELVASDVVAGGSLRLSALGAAPGEVVRFALSTEGVGEGPCLPALGGACLGLAGSPRLLGSVVADAEGLATLVVPLPAALPPGASVGVQAVLMPGASRPPVLSTPLTKSVGAQSCEAGLDVCGWDGLDYDSACEAERAGWPLRHFGSCP